MAAGRPSHDTVPSLALSKGTAVFAYLEKLRVAQINCQLESAQCALFLESTRRLKAIPWDSLAREPCI